MALESEKATLVSSISSLSEKIAGAVKQAKADFKAASDVYDFMSTTNKTAGIRKLFIMPLYIECFNVLNVKTRSQLEDLWAKHYNEREVRAAVQKLLKCEDSFREFAVNVDNVLKLQEKKSNPVPSVGQELPKDLALLDTETGQNMPLESYWQTSRFTWFVFIRHFG